MTPIAWLVAIAGAAGSIAALRAPALGSGLRRLIGMQFVALILGWVLVVLWGGSAFGFIAALWGLGVGGSVTFAALAWRLWRHHRAWSALSIAVALVAVAIAVYGMLIGPRDLEVNVHRIVSSRVDAPLRVAVVADLQTDRIGAYEERVFETLAGLDADVLVLPGDLLQLRDGPERDRQWARMQALFDAVAPAFPAGVYGVDGDVESGGRLLPKGVVSVSDRLMGIDGRDDVQIMGLSNRRSMDPTPVRTTARVGFDGLSLVVGHRPGFMWPALRGEDGGPGLFIAGHTHGGQIVIPGFGPPLTLSSVPRHIAAGGLHRTDEEQWVIVSRGVGMERLDAPRVRLFCPPEIVVLDIVPAPSTGATDGDHKKSAAE